MIAPLSSCVQGLDGKSTSEQAGTREERRHRSGQSLLYDHYWSSVKLDPLQTIFTDEVHTVFHIGVQPVDTVSIRIDDHTDVIV